MINVIRNNQNRFLVIDPLTGAAAITAGGAIIGGLTGNVLAGQQAQALQGANRLQALAALAQLSNRPPVIPEIQYTRYGTPEEYQLAGTLTPEALSDTELADITRNEQMRQAQLDVLRQYQEMGTEGLSAIDRAALSDIQNQIAMQERGQRETILQNMAQRGLSGSGQELAASLAASQQATQDASMQGMRQAAMAQANRQAALERIANLSGGLEQTDFEREALKARAQDVINQFNTQNRILAKASDLENLQNIMNMRTAERNKYKLMDVDLENREKYQNLIGRPMAQAGLQSDYTSGVTGALGGIAQSQANQAMQQYQTQAGMIGAGLQTGGKLGSAFYNKPSSANTPATSKPPATGQQVKEEIGFFDRLGSLFD